MLMWLLPFVALGLHLAYARYNLEEVSDDWSDLLSPEWRRQVAALRTQAEVSAFLLDDTYAAAVRAHSRTVREEALRLLGLARDVLDQATDDRRARIQGMRKCVRMLSAVLPMPPLLPGSFRLRGVKSLAALGFLAHHFLVSGGERFVLRLSLLRWGFSYARHTGARAVADAGAGRAAAWVHFEAAVADFKVLDREHVEAFRVLLESAAVLPVAASAVPDAES